MVHRFVTKVLCAAALMLGSATSFAAACTSILGTSTTALGTDDVTINGIQATDCHGHAKVGANSLANVVAYANTSLPAAWDDGWTGVLRANASATSGTGNYGGLSFGVSGLSVTANAGDFILSIADPDPLNAPSIPIVIDLLFTLKAGKVTDFYYFDDLLLAGSNDGTYEVSILNPQGTAFQNLSDISLLARDLREVPGCGANGAPCAPEQVPSCQPGSTDCAPQQVPEPGSLVLAGLALAAAARVRRHRRGQ